MRKRAKAKLARGSAATAAHPKIAYLKEYLGVIGQFLHAQGIDLRTASRMLAKMADEPPRPATLSAQAVEAGSNISDVMRRWTTDTRFVDEAGAPAALPLEGKVSFASLVNEVLPGANLPATLEHALNRELIILRADGTIKCVNRTASFRKTPADRIARQTFVMEQLFATEDYNSKEPRRTRRRLESAVHATILASDAPQFQALARLQGKALIDALDDKLEQCVERARRSSGVKVTVGLEAFMYLRRLTDPVPRKRKRSRGRSP